VLDGGIPEERRGEEDEAENQPEGIDLNPENWATHNLRNGRVSPVASGLLFRFGAPRRIGLKLSEPCSAKFVQKILTHDRIG